MRHHLVLSAALATLSLAAPALAQPVAGAAPQVTVAIGPTLQQKAADYGARELTDLSKDLREEVQGALKRAQAGAPARVDLVIEDATPNRPTFAQLGRTVGLSLNSVGLGGARVSGTATFADGSQRPIREQFFETDLRDERGLTTWSDADRAFDRVAYAIGHGKFSADYAGPGPTGSGHFGYPFTNQ